VLFTECGNEEILSESFSCLGCVKTAADVGGIVERKYSSWFCNSSLRDTSQTLQSRYTFSKCRTYASTSTSYRAFNEPQGYTTLALWHQPGVCHIGMYNTPAVENSVSQSHFCYGTVLLGHLHQFTYHCYQQLYHHHH